MIVKRYGFLTLRYVITVLLLIYIILLALFGGGSTRSFDEVANAISSAMTDQTMEEVDELGFKRRFGMNATEFDGVLMYANQFRLSADEVLLVKASSYQQLEELQARIETRMASRQQDFQGFSQEQAYHIEHAVITVRGLFLYLGVGPNAVELNRVFLDAL